MEKALIESFIFIAQEFEFYSRQWNSIKKVHYVDLK